MGNPTQFKLRHMFLLIMLFGCLFGAYAWLGRAKAAAHREAVRQAVQAGRITPEAARRYLGDEADQLPPTNRAK
jgi:hypothetical protein